jgi:hypothetical protein
MVVLERVSLSAMTLLMFVTGKSSNLPLPVPNGKEVGFGIVIGKWKGGICCCNEEEERGEEEGVLPRRKF